MKTSQYKDGLAMLDNLLDGRALPDHLARSRAGQVLPKHRNATESQNAELRRKNQETADAIGAKINAAPLVAVCYANACVCGNTWQGFGFYARRATQRIFGEGDATFTRRVDYKPSCEVVTATEWFEVKHETCINCFTEVAPPRAPAARIGGVTMLAELVHTAKRAMERA